MDFLKKNTSSEDDDIFELTDIIEKGPEDASAGSSQNQAMETQMNDLFAKGNRDEQPVVPDDIDADLDALLSDMQPAPVTESTARTTTAPLDVDEELDMPNMSEVDALLEGLDIPPQPDNNAASSPSARDATDLDDLLDGLLDSAPPAASATAAAQSPAAKEEPGMNLDDLDALFAADSASPEPAKPKAPAEAKATAPESDSNDSFNLDDLDALFAADSTSPEPAKPKAAAEPKATAAESDSNDSFNLDDLDALFAADSASPEPAKPKAAAAPKAATLKSDSNDSLNLDDLDALFAANAIDDAAAPAAAAEAEPAKKEPKAAAPKKAPVLSLEDELDALLGAPAAAHAADALTAPAKPNKKTKGAAANAAGHAVPAAEVANSADTSAASPSPTPAAASSGSSALDPEFRSLEDDLDAILGSMDGPPPVNTDTALPHELDSQDEDPVDMSDLGESTEDTEDFLADIFDTDKDSPDQKSLADDDLLAGLDVLDGLDGLDGLDAPLQPTDAATLEKFEALQSQKEERQPFSATQEVQDIAMISADNLADMPVMPNGSPTTEAEIPQLDELDKMLSSPRPSTPQAADQQLLTAVQAFQQDEFIENIDIDSELLATQTAEAATIGDDLTFAEEFSDEDITRAAQELLDDKVRDEASLENVDTNAWISSLDEVLGEVDAESINNSGNGTKDDTDFTLQLPDQGDSVNLDNLLSHLPDTTETAHYVYSPTKQAAHNSLLTNSDAASAPKRSPRESNTNQSYFEQSYTQELTRLQTITERFASSLAEADARIATLTQNAKSEVALEAMFRTDGPFSTSLQHAVRTAVATELRDHTPGTPASPTGPDLQRLAALQAEVTALQENVATLQAEKVTQQAESAALQEKNSALEKSVHEAQERISALEDGNKEARLQTVETRLDGQAHTAQSLEERCRLLEARLEEQARSQAEMAQNFHHEVEKAAAAAAARIIREEIAGILSGQ